MAEKIPRRSKSASRKAIRASNTAKNKKAKEQRIKEQRQREKDNIAAAKADPDGLTPYKREKFEKNKARIEKKYGAFRPGIKIGEDA